MVIQLDVTCSGAAINSRQTLLPFSAGLLRRHRRPSPTASPTAPTCSLPVELTRQLVVRGALLDGMEALQLELLPGLRARVDPSGNPLVKLQALRMALLGDDPARLVLRQFVLREAALAGGHGSAPDAAEGPTLDLLSLLLLGLLLLPRF